jgi:hypothetical protein
MQVGGRRFTLGSAVAVMACVTGAVLAGSPARAQAPAAGGPGGAQMVEQVFKDVQVLKGITVDEFMEAMGMFAAATTKDCSGCHSPDVLTDSREAFQRNTPMIQKARQMIVMMNTINRTFFGSQKRITCYTCHSATSVPHRAPNLTVQYNMPTENQDRFEFTPLPARATDVDAIFAKYLTAVGGAQAWGGVKSFTLAGSYAGWDTSHVEIPFDAYAQAPGKFTTIIHRKEGPNIYATDGAGAWYAGVDQIVANLTTNYTGGNLVGARVEALVQVAPHLIRRAFSEWQVSEDALDNVGVTVLRGSNPGETPVNLYFDDDGMLVRMVKWSDGIVGPVPTRIDFSDYRQVGSVKKPFQWVRTWTNNRAVYKVKDVRLNAPVEASRFDRPAPVPIK